MRPQLPAAISQQKITRRAVRTPHNSPMGTSKPQTLRGLQKATVSCQNGCSAMSATKLLIVNNRQNVFSADIRPLAPCAPSLEAVRAQKALLALHLSCWWPRVPALKVSLRTLAPAIHLPYVCVQMPRAIALSDNECKVLYCRCHRSVRGARRTHLPAAVQTCCALGCQYHLQLPERHTYPRLAGPQQCSAALHSGSLSHALEAGWLPAAFAAHRTLAPSCIEQEHRCSRACSNMMRQYTLQARP